MSTHHTIVFHHPAEIPLPDTHKFHDLPYSGDLFIHLLPSLVTAREELLQYSPEHRKCYFSHERKLSLFRSYTQRNCQLECRVNCSLSLCDCVPFYLPRLNNTVRICGRQHTIDCAELYLPAILGGRYTWREIVLHYRQWVGDRIQSTFKDYEYSRGGSIGGPKNLSDELLKSTYPDCICDCPATCTSLHYDVEINQQPLPDDFGIETTRIALSFKEREFASVLRKELIGLTDFIAVPQTAENNLSGPPGENHDPCPNYQRWHTTPLLLKDNQRASVRLFHPAHHTFYRADPPEGCRLCGDAFSEDIDLFSKRRSDATLEEGDCSTILVILMPGCNLHQFSLVQREPISRQTQRIQTLEYRKMVDTDSGGVLGVFTGFSFLALVELIYYLTLRLWNNIKHSWDDEEEECVNHSILTGTTTN
ncbi:hypothetical protein J6590_030271 [Homalodisca vitripennis]|nr:hypothetical protein J6590_030271 [Homalodisca vitripennis]